jgi:hypothetical protein
MERKRRRRNGRRKREEAFRGLRINSPLLARGAVFRTWPFLLSSVHILPAFTRRVLFNKDTFVEINLRILVCLALKILQCDINVL